MAILDLFRKPLGEDLYTRLWNRMANQEYDPRQPDFMHDLLLP